MGHCVGRDSTRVPRRAGPEGSRFPAAARRQRLKDSAADDTGWCRLHMDPIGRRGFGNESGSCASTPMDEIGRQLATVLLQRVFQRLALQRPDRGQHPWKCRQVLQSDKLLMTKVVKDSGIARE